ncbi:MAG: flagellar biosynthesis protein, partial [Alteromonadaceae bacterium]
MAEEFDKSEEATPYKLQEARKKGQVSRSMELPAFFSLAAMLLALTVSIGNAASMIYQHTQWWLSHAHQLAQSQMQLNHHFNAYVQHLAQAVLPVILSGTLAAVIASLVNIGPLFSMQPLSPDFSKLNPVTGIKKIFSRKSLVELGKLVVKIGLFSATAYMVWQQAAVKILNSKHTAINEIIQTWLSLFLTLAYSLLFTFLIAALFDLWFSKKEFSRQMRMSKRDVKDENKRREGDPEIKSKRKRALNELLQKTASVKRVKDADVIITNPSHVAVALQYQPNTMARPIVLGKGHGFLASNI